VPARFAAAHTLRTGMRTSANSLSIVS
jgi:hypothetical protein